MSAPAVDMAPRLPLLCARDLCFARGARVLFEGLSFELWPGQVTALLGPNGVGKSTLCGLLAGLERPRGGAIALAGEPIGRLSRRAIARSIALLQQERLDDVPYTVRELVLLGRAPHQDALGRAGARDEAVVRDILAEVGLAPLADRPVRKLSGGERRRAFLAQALAQEPRLLLLDEPTAFLDLKYQALFWEIVSRRVAAGLCALAVLHDPNLAVQWADQVVLMPAQGACRVGSAGAMLTLDNLEALYGAELQAARGEAGDRLFALRNRQSISAR